MGCVDLVIIYCCLHCYLCCLHCYLCCLHCYLCCLFCYRCFVVLFLLCYREHRAERIEFTLNSTTTNEMDDLTSPSIPVMFTTKTPYQLPPQKFMIPASWRRFQLSQLINTALALPRIVPFDFLIRGVLLGGSLSEAGNGEVSRTRSPDTGACK